MYTKTERKLFSAQELAERDSLIKDIVILYDDVDDLRGYTTAYLRRLYTFLFDDDDLLNEICVREKMIKSIFMSLDEDDLHCYTTEYLKDLHALLYPEVD